jgi:hypothetical protein
MKVCKTLFVGVMIVIMVSLVGCCGGSSPAPVQNQTTTTTLGDELKALKDAYDKGIITEKQYEESKADLIKNRTKKE